MREAVHGDSFIPTLAKAGKREGSGLRVAPVLFVAGRDDERARAVAEELFDALGQEPAAPGQATQVTVAPYGDGERDDEEELQAVAVVAAYAAEDDVATGAFARVVSGVGRMGSADTLEIRRPQSKAACVASSDDSTTDACLSSN